MAAAGASLTEAAAWRTQRDPKRLPSASKAFPNARRRRWAKSCRSARYLSAHSVGGQTFCGSRAGRRRRSMCERQAFAGCGEFAQVRGSGLPIVKVLEHSVQGTSSCPLSSASPGGLRRPPAGCERPTGVHDAAVVAGRSAVARAKRPRRRAVTPLRSARVPTVRQNPRPSVGFSQSRIATAQGVLSSATSPAAPSPASSSDRRPLQAWLLHNSDTSEWHIRLTSAAAGGQALEGVSRRRRRHARRHSAGGYPPLPAAWGADAMRR
jgi:hypothetical protein